MTEKLDLKVILLGSSGAGKTSLLTRYMQGNFTDNPSTIGASFQLKTWKNYKLGLWDTAGQERYASLSSYYCRGVGAAILVYDVSDSTSFEALDTYLKLLRAVQPDCYCILVGTKCDMLLPNEQGQLDTLMRASQQCLFLYTTPSMNALGGSKATLYGSNVTDGTGTDSGTGGPEEWDMVNDAEEVSEHSRAEDKNSTQSKHRKESAELSAGEIEDHSERVIGRRTRGKHGKKKHRSVVDDVVPMDGGDESDDKKVSGGNGDTAVPVEKVSVANVDAGAGKGRAIARSVTGEEEAGETVVDTAGSVPRGVRSSVDGVKVRISEPEKELDSIVSSGVRGASDGSGVGAIVGSKTVGSTHSDANVGDAVVGGNKVAASNVGTVYDGVVVATGNGERVSSGCADAKYSNIDDSHSEKKHSDQDTLSRSQSNDCIISENQSDHSISSKDQSAQSSADDVDQRRRSEHSDDSGSEDNEDGKVLSEGEHNAIGESEAENSTTDSDTDNSNSDSNSNSESESEFMSSNAESICSEDGRSLERDSDTKHTPVRVWHGPPLDSGPIFAEREGMDFVYVSAKTGRNVVSIFDRIGYKCLETKRVQHEMLASPSGGEVSTVNLNALMSKQAEKRSKCC